MPPTISHKRCERWHFWAVEQRSNGGVATDRRLQRGKALAGEDARLVLWRAGAPMRAQPLRSTLLPGKKRAPVTNLQPPTPIKSCGAKLVAGISAQIPHVTVGVAHADAAKGHNER